MLRKQDRFVTNVQSQHPTARPSSAPLTAAAERIIESMSGWSCVPRPTRAARQPPRCHIDPSLPLPAVQFNDRLLNGWTRSRQPHTHTPSTANPRVDDDRSLPAACYATYSTLITVLCITMCARRHCTIAPSQPTGSCVGHLASNRTAYQLVTCLTTALHDARGSRSLPPHACCVGHVAEPTRFPAQRRGPTTCRCAWCVQPWALMPLQVHLAPPTPCGGGAPIHAHQQAPAGTQQHRYRQCCTRPPPPPPPLL